MFNSTISGNIGRAAEVKTINGNEYWKFSVAVNGKRENYTQWVSVLYYRSSSSSLGQHLVAGTGVIVTGRIQVSAYKGKDGEPHADITIWADNVEITKYKEGGNVKESSSSNENDDLPWE